MLSNTDVYVQVWTNMDVYGRGIMMELRIMSAYGSLQWVNAVKSGVLDAGEMI